ncbi:polyprenyl synthetase family protein [Limibacterium fermenti]|uniref:polyprenyl synthetase family protein n=1 Tax=Limibacterium fermenti TaxID=3229863 RepID=UPI000E9F01D4|nr:isoprenyl synthetase [Porphyromonadaceae bacterium]HBX46678.1 isoprenyl synthetase [Porphyromonadaceae bacterium]
MFRTSELEKKINLEIENILSNDQPANLYDPIKYILSLGGKRVRPVMTLLGKNLFSETVDDAIDAALGIELFHNFSLLHDDLMDRSEKRRGQCTVHRKWNDNTAILSGDAMLIEAYKYIAEVPADLLPQILHLFSTVAGEVCKGQQYDMDFEQSMSVTETDYLEMIRLKTAVLMAGALKIGAIIARAPAFDSELLHTFGINIGMAFQLKDDLLDVYGDTKTFGKNIGGDILCNKKTYLLIKALKNSNEVQKKELEKWLSSTDYDPEEKIAAVKTIYDELKLKAICETFIEKYYLAALDCLSSIHVANERKKELISLAENLMYREK